MKDEELNRHLINFEKAHHNAAVRYCKKNDIDVKSIRCIYEEPMAVKYLSNGKIFFTARMEETFKIRLKFRQNQPV
jgi:hypothetical protein